MPKYAMEDDKVLGDGGNVTVYERPDGSLYALDHQGHGSERDPEDPVFGRARFDARSRATGRWAGSRSALSVDFDAAGPSRARRRGNRYRTG